MASRAALEAKVDHVADVARSNGRVPGVETPAEPGLVFDGTVIAESVEFVGLYRSRGEATVAAIRRSPSLLRDIGGSWIVFELKGRPQ